MRSARRAVRAYEAGSLEAHRLVFWGPDEDAGQFMNIAASSRSVPRTAVTTLACLLWSAALRLNWTSAAAWTHESV